MKPANPNWNASLVFILLSINIHLVLSRDIFGCTSNTTDTCIIDPLVHFPNGYSAFDNHTESDLVCDPQFIHCNISCIGGCGVANQQSGKYLKVYCPSTPGGGSCNIYSTGHFAMKYARVYGGDNNDLTLTFNSLSPPAQVYAPRQGGSLIINRLNVEYSGVNPAITVYSDTKNVILNCGDSPWCIKNTDIDLSQIMGYFHVTATAITDRNIYLPSNPTTPSSIDCNGDCSNLNVYTNYGTPYDVNWQCDNSLSTSCLNATLFCKPDLVAEIRSDWLYNDDSNVWGLSNDNCSFTRAPTSSPTASPTTKDPTSSPTASP